MDQGLPDEVRDVLWDVNAESAWREYPDFVVERVLSRGTWSAIQWVRKQVGDGSVREILTQSRCRLLTAPQIRFWQLILGLPEDDVRSWLSAPARQLFDKPAP